MMRIGFIRELTRFPVKSMAGVRTESAELGWHGLAGDRRFAFHRLGDNSEFPWLNASRFTGLIRYEPFGFDESSSEPVPTHVRTPSGKKLELGGEELREEIERASGTRVELMRLKNGFFDDAPVSVISAITIAAIGTAAQLDLDRRRFRANICLDTQTAKPFCEDAWVGGTLVFGDGDSAPAVRVTQRDVRCMMINLDPDTAVQDARVLKTVVRLNLNNAGVYGTVMRPGALQVGQTVNLVLD